jgi:sugar phosphate isomerase/epimerase
MLHLGLVTYNLARDWDLDTLLRHCEEAGLQGVELRTTHAHGVEPSLDAPARRQVRARFAASPVRLVGLGTVCEYHALDPEEVEANIRTTQAFVDLAADLGCPGVKVRPNGHQERHGVPRARTLRQIGEALRRCGEYAAARGVEIRLEMHGAVAAAPDIAAILEATGSHPAVRVCWNCNAVDVHAGSIADDFAQLRGRIGLVHIQELWSPAYPWAELFALLRESGYDGFCLAEIPPSPDAPRLLRYYRALFESLARVRPASGAR